MPVTVSDTPGIIDDTNGWRTAGVDQALKTRPAVFRCPSDIAEDIGYDGLAVGSYAFCAGSRGPTYGVDWSVKYYNDGMFMYRVFFKPRDVTDGLSNTIFVGEASRGDKPESANVWSMSYRYLWSFRIADNPINTPPGIGVTYSSSNSGIALNGAFVSEHPGGAMFVFGDSHVEFLEESIDQATYRALATRDGGNW